jgi:hypothetical protein
MVGLAGCAVAAAPVSKRLTNVQIATADSTDQRNTF